MKSIGNLAGRALSCHFDGPISARISASRPNAVREITGISTAKSLTRRKVPMLFIPGISIPRKNLSLSSFLNFASASALNPPKARRVSSPGASLSSPSSCYGLEIPGQLDRVRSGAGIGDGDADIPSTLRQGEPDNPA